MYLCFFFCKKINVEAREFSLTPTFIIEPIIVEKAVYEINHKLPFLMNFYEPFEEIEDDNICFFSSRSNSYSTILRFSAIVNL